MANTDQTHLTWHPDSRIVEASGVSHACPAATPPSGKGCILVSETSATDALLRIYQGGKAAHGFCVHRADQTATLPDHGNTAPYLCCMTSGTTSSPKVIIRSQSSWRRSITVNQTLWTITPDDNYATLGALSHSLSLYASAEALQLGADLHLLGAIRPDKQVRHLHDRQISILYATPAQLRQIAAHSMDITFPALRLILIGGSKLEAETRSAIQTLAPNAAIHEFYGASETSFITLAGPETPAGSVGQPYPGVSLTIRSDTGTPLSPGETGEIWVESPYLFQTYAGAADDYTQRNGLALTVGEYGRLDTQGNLWIAGRKGRMITIADQNVFPEEVEDCLLSLPQITRAAALPVPDTQRGFRLIACVEVATPITDDAILAHCRTILGALKAPRQILRPTPFPTLTSGKPDLTAIAALTRGQDA